MSKTYNIEALEYIAKIADGGLRDAVTLLDKCLSYSTELTLENVVKALGTVDYEVMFKLTDAIIQEDYKQVVSIIEDIHNAGKDLKQFIKQYTHFLLDIRKYAIGCDWTYMSIPRLPEYEKWMKDCGVSELDICDNILKCCMKLNVDIKYSTTPKLDIEVVLLQEA